MVVSLHDKMLIVLNMPFIHMYSAIMGYMYMYRYTTMYMDVGSD